LSNQLTEHFSAGPPDRLACQDDCGFGSVREDYAPGFLDFLETLRLIYGRPIHPTSGARCVSHNRAVGGVNRSAHTRAAAGDLSASNGFDRHGLLVASVLAAAVLAGRMELADAISIAAELAAHAGGIGLAKTFVHVDNDVQLPRPSAWGYPPNTHNQ
jgi:hypothetical protein